MKHFQNEVGDWLIKCFGVRIAADKIERNHRFLEESLEAVQSLGCTREEAHTLVDYVFGRPKGEPFQEVGGVMTTLAALCFANNLDMFRAGHEELCRIWGKMEQIRAKQAAKPKGSALPQFVPYCMDANEKEIYDFLCQKYVQRADARQMSLGLQYTEAETHDLARELVKRFGGAE